MTKYSDQCFISDPIDTIDNLWEDYKCQWPPRPDFADWPTSWQAYQIVCDVMPQQLRRAETAKLFREWLTDELTQKVGFNISITK